MAISQAAINRIVAGVQDGMDAFLFRIIMGFTFVTENVFTSNEHRADLAERAKQRVGGRSLICNCRVQNVGFPDPELLRQKCTNHPKRTNKCRNLNDEIECDVKCDENCLNRPFVAGQMMKERFRLTHYHGRGFGLKTTTFISRGSFVMEYTGLVRFVTEEEEELEEMARELNYAFRIAHTNYVVDARDFGNQARFINHSCDPNLKALSYVTNGTIKIVLVAIKNIPPGHELTLNYRDVMKGHRCLCAADKCLHTEPKKKAVEDPEETKHVKEERNKAYMQKLLGLQEGERVPSPVAGRTRGQKAIGSTCAKTETGRKKLSMDPRDCLAKSPCNSLTSSSISTESMQPPSNQDHQVPSTIQACRRELEAQRRQIPPGSSSPCDNQVPSTSQACRRELEAQRRAIQSGSGPTPNDGQVPSTSAACRRELEAQRRPIPSGSSSQTSCDNQVPCARQPIRPECGIPPVPSDHCRMVYDRYGPKVSKDFRQTINLAEKARQLKSKIRKLRREEVLNKEEQDRILKRRLRKYREPDHPLAQVCYDWQSTDDEAAAPAPPHAAQTAQVENLLDFIVNQREVPVLVDIADSPPPLTQRNVPIQITLDATPPLITLGDTPSPIPNAQRTPMRQPTASPRGNAAPVLDVTLSPATTLELTQVGSDFSGLSNESPCSSRHTGGTSNNSNRTRMGSDFSGLSNESPCSSRQSGGNSNNSNRTRMGSDFSGLSSESPCSSRQSGRNSNNSNRTRMGSDFSGLSENMQISPANGLPSPRRVQRESTGEPLYQFDGSGNFVFDFDFDAASLSPNSTLREILNQARLSFSPQTSSQESSPRTNPNVRICPGRGDHGGRVPCPNDPRHLCLPENTGPTPGSRGGSEPPTTPATATVPAPSDKVGVSYEGNVPCVTYNKKNKWATLRTFVLKKKKKTDKLPSESEPQAGCSSSVATTSTKPTPKEDPATCKKKRKAAKKKEDKRPADDVNLELDEPPPLTFRVQIRQNDDPPQPKNKCKGKKKPACKSAVSSTTSTTFPAVGRQRPVRLRLRVPREYIQDGGNDVCEDVPEPQPKKKLAKKKRPREDVPEDPCGSPQPGPSRLMRRGGEDDDCQPGPSRRLRRDIGDDQRKHKCGQCPESFIQKIHLIEHMIRHRNARRHGCKTCGKKFNMPRDLQRHEETHNTNRTIYPCPTPNCPKMYKTKHGMRRHEKECKIKKQLPPPQEVHPEQEHQEDDDDNNQNPDIEDEEQNDQ